VAIVSAIGSALQVTGILAKAVATLAESDIGVQAMHQSMRQVGMQFVAEESDYEDAIKRMHAALVEVHDHGLAICTATV
jgi:aspartate kinase